MISKVVEIVNECGLHARPASEFVEKAQSFKCNVFIEKDGKKFDAKSILGVLALGAKKGSKVTITTEGDDEEKALSQLIECINSFEE